MNRSAPVTLLTSALIAAPGIAAVSAEAPPAMVASTVIVETLAPGPAKTGYHLLKKVHLPGDGGWDYLSIDSAARRFYISRFTHLMVVNADTGKVIGDIPNTAGVHGVVVDHVTGDGFTSNGRSDSVTVFKLKTLQTIGQIKVGHAPDAILFDPATRRIFTFNGRANTATAIDANTRKVVGTVSLPGRPEFPVADGRGYLFDAIEDKNEIAQINARTLKVEKVWPCAPGEGPSGLAMDTTNRLLFAVCDNQKMAVMSANDGGILATPTIGNGPDACAFDASSGTIFSSNGRDGTVTVLREKKAAGGVTVVPVGTFNSAPGARTIALDEKTHHLYTVTARALPEAPNPSHVRRQRRYVPGTFIMLVYGK